MDMMNLSDHYQYLFLGKVTGTLDPAEVSELDRLLDNDAEMQAAYEAFTSQLPAKYVSDSFDHLNRPGYWKDIARSYEKRRTAPLWRRLSSAAAVIILIVGGGYLLWPSWRQEIAVQVPGKKANTVQLKLAGGRSIDLSHTKGRINEGGTEAVNKDKVLSYASKDPTDVSVNEVSVPIGMDYQVALSDGTKIWMNSATHLYFPTNFHADAREISIDGEAYLEVAQDAKRPFTVRLPNSSVQVLGTALNVNTYHSDVTNVALVSGAIQFSGGQTNLILKPGEQVVYSGEGISKQTFDPKFVLSWKKGLYYFEAADLNDISVVIQRWFGVNTMIDSKDLLNTKVAGVLDKHQPLENFLDDLKAIAHIQAYFDKSGVLHFK